MASDRGANFLSLSISSVYKKLGLIKHSTSPYHPQADGVVEKLNGTLINAISHMVNDIHTDWDRHLDFALSWHIDQPNILLQVFPHPKCYMDEILTEQSNSTYAEVKDYAHDLTFILKKSFDIVDKNLIQSADAQEKYREKSANRSAV